MTFLGLAQLSKIFPELIHTLHIFRLKKRPK